MRPAVIANEEHPGGIQCDMPRIFQAAPNELLWNRSEVLKTNKVLPTQDEQMTVPVKGPATRIRQGNPGANLSRDDIDHQQFILPNKRAHQETIVSGDSAEDVQLVAAVEALQWRHGVGGVLLCVELLTELELENWLICK